MDPGQLGCESQEGGTSSSDDWWSDLNRRAYRAWPALVFAAILRDLTPQFVVDGDGISNH